MVEHPNRAGHLRVEALVEQKSYRKLLRDLNRGAIALQDKIPRRLLNQITMYGLRYLRALTPRYIDKHMRRPHNRPGGDHSPTIGASWVKSKIRKSPSRGMYQSMYNAKMATLKGRTVLRVLETGSRPHSIPRVRKTDNDNPPFLSFFWEQVGEFVRTRHVFHPGTRPYQIVGKTYFRLLFLLERIKDVAEGEAANIFRGKPGGGG